MGVVVLVVFAVVVVKWRVSHRHRRGVELRANVHASSIQTTFASRRPSTMKVRKHARRW